MLICSCTYATGQKRDSSLYTPEIPVAAFDLKLDSKDFDFMRKYRVKYQPYRNACNPLTELHRKRKALKKDPPIFLVYKEMDKKYGKSWRKEINPNASFIEEYLYKYPNASDSKVK